MGMILRKPDQRRLAFKRMEKELFVIFKITTGAEIFFLTILYAILASSRYITLYERLFFDEMFIISLIDSICLIIIRPEQLRPSSIQKLVAVIVPLQVFLFSASNLGIYYNFAYVIIVATPIVVFEFFVLSCISPLKNFFKKIDELVWGYSLNFMAQNISLMLLSLFLIYLGRGQAIGNLVVNDSFILVTVAMMAFVATVYSTVFLIVESKKLKLSLTWEVDKRFKKYEVKFKKTRGMFIAAEVYGTALVLTQITLLIMGIPNDNGTYLLIGLFLFDFIASFCFIMYRSIAFLEKIIES